MDEREGQVFRDYDCFFNEIVDGCNKFNIEKPAMLMKEPDHTCFTYYHKNKKNNEDEKLQEKEEKKKVAASNLIRHLVENNKLSCLVQKKGGVEGEIYSSNLFIRVSIRLHAKKQFLGCLEVS